QTLSANHLTGYIRQLTAFEIIARSISIYACYFPLVVLNILPGGIVFGLINHYGNKAFESTDAFFYSMIAGTIASFCLAIVPLTVTVSEIYLGNRPNVIRAYMRL